MGGKEREKKDEQVHVLHTLLCLVVSMSMSSAVEWLHPYLVIMHCNRWWGISLVYGLPGDRNTLAAAENHEDDADNSKDHEDDKSSMAKLYKQINIIFIACKLYYI